MPVLRRDSCLGRPGLRFPEPADAEFVARVRAAIAAANRDALECSRLDRPPLPPPPPPVAAPVTDDDDRYEDGQCSADVQLGARWTGLVPCSRRASVVRSGLGYCGQHDPERTPPVTPLPAHRPCKTDGCTNDANTTYDRGPLHGLCEEACIPVAREAIAQRARDSRAARSAGVAPPPAPPGGAEKPSTNGHDPDAHSLAALVAALEDARDALTAARTAEDEAATRFAAARVAVDVALAAFDSEVDA